MSTPHHVTVTTSAISPAVASWSDAHHHHPPPSSSFSLLSPPSSSSVQYRPLPSLSPSPSFISISILNLYPPLLLSSILNLYLPFLLSSIHIITATHPNMSESPTPNSIASSSSWSTFLKVCLSAVYLSTPSSFPTHRLPPPTNKP